MKLRWITPFLLCAPLWSQPNHVQEIRAQCNVPAGVSTCTTTIGASSGTWTVTANDVVTIFALFGPNHDATVTFSDSQSDLFGPIKGSGVTGGSNGLTNCKGAGIGGSISRLCVYANYRMTGGTSSITATVVGGPSTNVQNLDFVAVESTGNSYFSFDTTGLWGAPTSSVTTDTANNQLVAFCVFNTTSVTSPAASGLVFRTLYTDTNAAVSASFGEADGTASTAGAYSTTCSGTGGSVSGTVLLALRGTDPANGIAQWDCESTASATSLTVPPLPGLHWKSGTTLDATFTNFGGGSGASESSLPFVFWTGKPTLTSNSFVPEPTSPGGNVFRYYAQNVVDTANSVTISSTNAQKMEMCVADLTGMATSSPYLNSTFFGGGRGQSNSTFSVPGNDLLANVYSGMPAGPFTTSSSVWAGELQGLDLVNSLYGNIAYQTIWQAFESGAGTFPNAISPTLSSGSLEFDSAFSTTTVTGGVQSINLAEMSNDATQGTVYAYWEGDLLTGWPALLFVQCGINGAISASDSLGNSYPPILGGGSGASYAVLLGVPSTGGANALITVVGGGSCTFSGVQTKFATGVNFKNSSTGPGTSPLSDGGVTLGSGTYMCYAFGGINGSHVVITPDASWTLLRVISTTHVTGGPLYEKVVTGPSSPTATWSTGAVTAAIACELQTPTGPGLHQWGGNIKGAGGALKAE